MKTNKVSKQTFVWTLLLLPLLGACVSPDEVGVEGVSAFQWPTLPRDLVEVMGNTKQILELNVLDSEGDSVTFEITVLPLHGTLSEIQVTGPLSATVEYTPEQDYHGEDSFVVRLVDIAMYETMNTVELFVDNGDPGLGKAIAIAETCDGPNSILSGLPWPFLLLDEYDQNITVDPRSTRRNQG